MKCCSIMAAETDVARLSVERVTGALDDGTLAEDLVPWFHVALALTDFRRGDFAAAEQSAETAPDTADFLQQRYRVVVRALAGAIRSLALSGMDPADDARAAPDVAREHLSRLVQRHPGGSIVGRSLFVDGDNFDHDRLIADSLIREAASVLDR